MKKSNLNPPRLFHDRIPGNHLFSSVDAGAHFGVTNDYITRLCRTGKVEGFFIKGKWFVDKESLRKYLGRMRSRRGSLYKTLSEKLREEYKANLEKTGSMARDLKKHTSSQKSPRSRFFSLLQAFFTVLLFVGVSAAPLPAHASQTPPLIISYQGRLADSSGNLLGGSGTTYYFKFSIWNSGTVGTGTQLWPTTLHSVSTTVTQGIFTVNIGDTANGYPDPLNFDFSSNNNLYLQVEVSSNNSTFETLSPRQQLTSAIFSQLAGSVVGTTTPSLFGTTVPVANSFVTIAATSTGSIPLSIVGAFNQIANLFQVQNSVGTNLFSINATGGVSALAATTTSFFATTASSTSLFTSNLSVGSLSGFLKATAGAVATALVNLTSDVTGVLPIGNGGTGTSTAPSYGQLLVGNSSGVYTLMATSTLGLGGSSGTVSSVGVSGGSTGLTTSGGPITSSGTITLAGVLNLANGGTGLSSAPAYGNILVGNSGSGYTLTATSSLGLASLSSFSATTPLAYNS
ncbi:MAG: helix-turn-helix domain-containing protein, partial [Patescibacteria group bacterium]|nr:helix-turn-helix domain-containing protein [Patescibacteria group bacterium]